MKSATAAMSCKTCKPMIDTKRFLAIATQRALSTTLYYYSIVRCFSSHDSLGFDITSILSVGCWQLLIFPFVLPWFGMFLTINRLDNIFARMSYRI
jgi:hypothetical protein